MSTLINGRTPEEIKTGLSIHATWGQCKTCPYETEKNAELGHCIDWLTKDVYSLVEHLESERDAALAKVPRWISVEEKLPSQNGDYLIHYRFKKQGKGKGFYSVCFYERTCERPHFYNEGYCGMYVTHWMPLPSAEGLK